jgi:hypothetical protein
MWTLRKLKSAISATLSMFGLLGCNTVWTYRQIPKFGEEHVTFTALRWMRVYFS